MYTGQSVVNLSLRDLPGQEIIGILPRWSWLIVGNEIEQAAVGRQTYHWRQVLAVRWADGEWQLVKISAWIATGPTTRPTAYIRQLSPL
jgi:hypothetical protein